MVFYKVSKINKEKQKKDKITSFPAVPGKISTPKFSACLPNHLHKSPNDIT